MFPADGLIFQRGYFAGSRAEKERDHPSGFLWTGRDLPVVDALDGDSSLLPTEGALAVSFTGRFARRAERVQVVIPTSSWLFSTARVDALRLTAGWYPIVVPQSRYGVNAGAVQILAGHVTLLEYRPNVWGPPGGKFVHNKIDATDAMTTDDFLHWRERHNDTV